MAGFLLQALLELWYIPKLIANFDIYGLNLSWSTWFKIHELLVISFTVGGALIVGQQAKQWWNYLYVEHCGTGILKSLRQLFVLK